MKVGDLIRMKRAEKRLRQSDVEKTGGLSYGSLAGLERENSNPTVSTLKKVAKGLDCHLIITFVENN